MNQESLRIILKVYSKGGVTEDEAVQLIEDLYNKTISFNEKLNDIVSLIKVYCSEASGDIDFDAGILESTLAEFIRIVRYLLMENERQEKMINELYQLILQFAITYGEDPETVRNNIIQNTLESNNAK